MKWERRVYFARRADGSGPIKIGCSASLKWRLKQLCYDHGTTIIALASAPGGFDVEREVQSRFTRAVVPNRKPTRRTAIAGSSEWFVPTPELLSFIAQVAATETLPSPSRDAIIKWRRSKGETLQSIANDVGLTRERVRQIAAGY